MTNGAKCGKMDGTGQKSRSHRPLPTTDYEICLMLTRIFLGKEDSRAARNLYNLYTLPYIGGRYEDSVEAPTQV